MISNEGMAEALVMARVSSKEQAEGYSLNAQKKDLTSYTTKNNFRVFDSFQISETASKDKQRKIFNSKMKLLYKNPQVTEFVVEKVDRLTRNFQDTINIDLWLNKNDNNKIHFVKQNRVIHKNSKSDEIFIWRIEVAVAERTANNISEEVRKGMTQKAEEGWYPNNRKFGYRLVLKDRQKVWEKDPLEAQFVERMFRLYVSGMSIRGLRNFIYEQGLQRLGKPISVSYIQRVLRDPFYSGKFNWGGVTYDGKHGTIISPDVFYKAQDLLDGKNHPNATKRFFVYGRGLIKCQYCFHSLTGEMQKGFVYYRCHHCKGQKYQKEDLISTRILDHLSRFEVKSERLLGWVKDALSAYRDEEYLFNVDVVKNLEEQKKQVKTQRKTLYDNYTAKKVTEDFYNEQYNDYTEQITNLDASIASEERSEDLSYKLAVSIFELASKAKYLWLKKFTPEKKWKFLKLASSNIIADGDYLDISYKNGFNVLYNQEKKPLVNQKGFEPFSFDKNGGHCRI